MKDIIITIIWFIIGFIFGCNAKYSIILGSWKSKKHIFHREPTDEEIYEWSERYK